MQQVITLSAGLVRIIKAMVIIITAKILEGDMVLVIPAKDFRAKVSLSIALFVNSGTLDLAHMVIDATGGMCAGLVLRQVR